MKRSRLYTGSVVSVVMLVLALAGGVVSAAPVASARAFVAGSPARSHLTATSQRYVDFKEAQSDRMSGSGAAARERHSTSVKGAFNIAQPDAYAAMKDRQAGN